jgi:anti-anti-sigma regulatory factor
METSSQPPASSFHQPPADEGAPPKLSIERFADGAISCLRLAGTIDESFEGKKLAASVSGDTLVVDLGGVKKISSFGIREWVDFITAASRSVRQLILIECAPKVVDQLNMVANFAGTGRVFSFYAPFRCDYCDSEHRVLLQVDKDYDTIKSMKLAERACPSCKESMYFDEDGATFFSYLLGQERFELDPEVAAFLGAKLDYKVADASRKLRVDKIIEGRITYLRLAGDLDRTFPRDKLAEGLEGLVIVDVASISAIDPAGAAAWRGFTQMIAPLVEQLYIVGVMPPFLDKLCGKDDLGPKGQVLTLALPYACGSCKTTSPHWLDVGEHFEVLRFATAPELRCTHCKAAMECVANEGLMTVLPALPKPTAAPGVTSLIPGLRDRAIAARSDKRKPSAMPAVTPPVAPARGSIWVPLLAAVIAVVLAAIGYVVYQKTFANKSPGGNELVGRTAAKRPDWVGDNNPGIPTCLRTDKTLSCTGLSTMSARQDDAEDEAADSAYEALAGLLAVEITDAQWRHTVVPIYQSAVAAKQSSLDRDPASTSARRDVREARHAVAQMLRVTSNGAVPAAPTARYREDYEGPDGKRYLAFAQVMISTRELARMVDIYTQKTSALGATAIGLFPLVGWRYPKLERGAIITTLGSGPLQDVGLAEQYVVLAIDGREVADATSFAKLATDEHDQLVEHGGTFRLKVQAGDGAPREFAQPIKAKEPEHGTHGPRQTAPVPTPGGINVWDRYNGGKRTGRDDPTQ